MQEDRCIHPGSGEPLPLLSLRYARKCSSNVTTVDCGVWMRMSNLFGATLRTAPGRTEAEGHQLLVRAGFVRRLGQGIFSYLPLGWRSLKKIENIMREEMDAVGGQELSMPVVHPAEV